MTFLSFSLILTLRNEIHTWHSGALKPTKCSSFVPQILAWLFGQGPGQAGVCTVLLGLGLVLSGRLFIAPTSHPFHFSPPTLYLILLILLKFIINS